jgi:hypothetical protein
MESAVRPEHPRAARSSRGAPVFDGGEGRIRRGFRLLGRAWELLSERPRLFALPLLSAALATLATVAIFVPVAVTTSGVGSYKLSFLIASAAAGVPLIFIATYLNVGFLGMVQDHIEGREPSVRRGLALARSRLRPIIAWTLVSATVGGILSALRALPLESGGELLARMVGVVGGIAWGLATYFVVPVLALHGEGTKRSVERSARAFRERWGETLSGAIGIGVITAIVVMPACMLGGGGAVALDEGNTTLGIVLIATAVLVFMPILAVEWALTELFALVVYREATEGIVIAPFTEADIRRSFEPKKPPLRQRVRDWFRG